MTRLKSWTMATAFVWTLGSLSLVLGLLAPGRAHACGCLTPPDPSVPVVQAGENIIFAVANSQTTAHIQIKYQGDAKDFGWLLPLPSLPTLELGSDELFASLIGVTQPKYRLSYIYPQNGCFMGGFGPQAGATSDLGAAFGGGDGGTKDNGGFNPLVVQDSIGPYDYAVLKADDKTAMLKWLNDNHYFVPVGSSDAAAPYLHAGAFFLALKLHSGASAGDIQPVVVHYSSDLPMIPIVLTSVGATPDMGVQVWMLGAGRAIPRNYEHTVINDAVIDWFKAGANYNDVIIRATHEAARRHTFVTEFAGSTDVMKGVLDGPGRFGTAADLYAITDAGSYVNYLLQHNYNFRLGPLVAILQKYIPEPAGVAAAGINAATFYGNLFYFLGTYRMQHPDQFQGASFNYDPKALTDEIQTSVVKPVLAAAKLFTDFPYLTRLYTTLSPADMNADPVFSYNPSLPAVSNIHGATLTLRCNMLSQSGYDGQLRTEQGFIFNVPGGFSPPKLPTLPASLRIEILREQGAPELQADNTASIHSSLGAFGDNQLALSGGACSVQSQTASRGGLASAFGLLLAAAGLLLRRARFRRSLVEARRSDRA